MLENDNDGHGRGNAAYQWKQFDPEYYFQHYYGDPHPDDDHVVRETVRALKKGIPNGNDLNIVDVGTGPNLIPMFCALPRAHRLTAWEYAESNIDWLRREIDRDALRPQWRHFWNTACDAYGAEWDLPDDPLPSIKQKCSIVQGSIFDLPASTWDAATMFFCAESITKRRDEFEAACAAFARCVQPGGTLAAAFLVSSEGYIVADLEFPALRVSPEAIAEVFAVHADDVRVETVGLVDGEIRSGYSGQAFLTARRRA